MAEALQELLSRRDADDRYDTSPADLLPLQLEAANERLATLVVQIPLLKNRAESGCVARVERAADLVPLLFAHNTYKSYAEAWLAEGKWDRMALWLSTVSTYEVGGSTDFDGVDSLDAWIERLEQQGRYVICSSGTTGKPAMLGATDPDLDFGAHCNVSSFSWATGIKPANDRKCFGLGPPVINARNVRIRRAMNAAYQSESEEPYQLPVPPIGAGSVMAMILLRRRIADGTAPPSEVAEFERLGAERQQAIDTAQDDAIEALAKSREQKLLMTGFLPTVYQMALGVRALGYGPGDFPQENAMLTGGGLKGVELPPDYRDVIFDTFNIAEERVFHLYSMQ